MVEEDHIPPTAKQVKVTNVIDPYHIRIYEVENHTERLNQLEQKLQQLSKTELRRYSNGCGPKIGDLVLVESNRDDARFKFELPAWFCRGVVLCEKAKESTYPVMLVDHGIVLHFWIEDLKILPPSSIPIDYLTTAIGINDIIPITVDDKVANFSDHWSEAATEFTRKMINASTSEYFDHLTSDKSGNRYGELYLIIENEIVPLSKDLVLNLFGTMLKDDSEKIKKEPDAPAPQASTASDDKPHSSKSMEENSEEKRKDVKKTVRMSKNVHTMDPDQRILISSEFDVKPIYSVEDAGFHSRLQKTLRSLKISRPKNLQGYVWPAVCRGLDVAVVESPKTGKTLSYLIPIISSIIGNESKRQARGPKGPFAIILCVSSMDVTRIFKACSEILKGNDNVAVLPAYNGIPEKTIVAKILNGCDIIISTPPYLSRLMRNDRELLNFDRISHMVFDGADVILRKYNNSLAPIFKIPDAVEKKRRGLINKIKLQIIVVAQYWTPEVKILVQRFMKNPYTCIASYMEAAVYAELKPQLIIQPRDEKAAKVVELLGTGWTMIKTIIVCVNTEEATELAQILTEKSIDNFLVHEKTIITEIRGIKETWMAMVSGKYFVLVCTDPVVLDLNIKDADCLIHYSLDSRSKTEFYRRFSTLINNFSLHVRNKGKIRPRVALLADENNNTQLSGIVRMLRRLDCKIPEALEANLEKVILTVEMEKTDRRLCEDLKAFGSCSNTDSCGSRHCVIPEVDKPITDIRANDWVKLVLMGIHSTNHYSARILEYQPAGTKEWIRFSVKEFCNLSIEMQKHFSDPTRRRSAKVVNIGDICAIEDAPDVYKRVQVLSSVVNKDEIQTQSVRVRCIDDGNTLTIKASHLLEVPDNLAEWPSHIVDMYLTDIIPFDNEPAWSPCAEDIVNEWFKENLAYSASCVFGKVLLHISYNMWIDPLEVRHELQSGFPTLRDSSLKNKLMDEKCAVENKGHVENLLKLCRDSNMETERTSEGTN